MLQTFSFDDSGQRRREEKSFSRAISVDPDVAAVSGGGAHRRTTDPLTVRTRPARSDILPATNVKSKRSSSHAALDLSAPFSVDSYD